jgi:hypothetical protein
MKMVFKSVALVLAMAVFAAPAAALSSCWTSPEEAPHGCPAGCPMMAMANAHPMSDAIQAAPSGNSCCNISSGKTTPTTQLQVPTDSTRTIVTPPHASLPLACPLVSARAESPGSSPPVFPASPQAVLCTFLI